MSTPTVRCCVRAAGRHQLTVPNFATRSSSFNKGIKCLPHTHRSVRQHSTNASSRPTSSVSQEEVNHFSRLASSWWDPHGPSRLLHLMNPLRHDFITSCLYSTSPDPPPRDQKYTYLDIGCGGGIFASSAARLPTTSSVTAIDPTPDVIAVAKTQQRLDPVLAEPKLTYLNCAIEDLPIATGKQVDILSIFEVIEHISSPSAFLNSALPHLRPGGWLVGSTIARSALSYLTTKVIAEAPIVGVVPPGTHDWNQYINPGELRSWFANGKAEGEFGKMRTQGVIYVPAIGWKFVDGSENLGNYFFAIQKLPKVQSSENDAVVPRT